MKRYIGLFLRAIISMAMLAYLSQKIDWGDFKGLWQAVDYHYLLIAFMIFGLAFFSAALRWYFLLHIQGIGLRLKAVTMLTLIGAFFNVFLLGSTGGDVAKLVYVFKSHPDKRTEATVSVIIDRLLGLTILLLLAIVFMAFKFQAFINMPQIHSVLSGILIIFLLLLSVAFFMLKMPFEKLPPPLRKMWQKIPLQNVLSRLLQGYRQHASDTPKLIYATGFSCLVQLCIFIAAFTLTMAINLNIHFIDLAIVITIVTCIISLPISIGGHGVREGAFLLMFSLFAGVNGNPQYFDQESVILFSLLYFMLGLVWSLIGGVIYLLFDPIKTISYIDTAN